MVIYSRYKILYYMLNILKKAIIIQECMDKNIKLRK
jgi:hypothetical protein